MRGNIKTLKIMTLQNKEIYKQKYLVYKLCVQGIKKELQIM